LSDILNDAMKSMAPKPLCNRKASIFLFWSVLTSSFKLVF
jgi:hypothetical protein